MTKDIIQLSKICKSFNGHNVLNQLDLNIEHGKSHVILGTSGSGKSVLLKNIIGLLEHDSGNVWIENVDITRSSSNIKKAILSKFGYLFQSGALFDSLTVEENVYFYLSENCDYSSSKLKEIAAEKLSQVGLGKDIMPVFPAELSGGMKKRVALARTICSNPKVIFFDEPTSGLDPIMANMINKLIKDISTNLGATTVIITHDITSARKLADTVSLLCKGRILWTGDASKMDKSNNKYIKQFVTGSLDGPIKIY